MSDKNAETNKGSAAAEKQEFQRTGFKFLGLGSQDIIRYFFGGNASLAIIVLILICVFLAREAAMFFPDHHRGLKNYRAAGQEFVDLIGEEIDQFTRVYSSANIAYFAEVKRTSLVENEILRAYRSVLANVERLTSKTWKQLDRKSDTIKELKDDLEELSGADEKDDAAIAKLKLELEDESKLAATLREKLANEVEVVIRTEAAWDLGAGETNLPTSARAKLLEAIVFEASPEVDDEHRYIQELKSTIREREKEETAKLVEYKAALKGLQDAARPIKNFHRDLVKVAASNKEVITSFSTAPERRQAWLDGAEIAKDPSEKARMLARADEVIIKSPDLDGMNAPIYASIDRHRELISALQSDVEKFYTELPGPNEVITKSARENLKDAQSYYKIFEKTARENRKKILDWRHDRTYSFASSVSAFLVGENWITNSSWHDFYGLLPLFLGSLLISLIALIVAVPFAVSAAIYVNQLASYREQHFIKPAIEFIEAIPSVVLGFFGILVFGETLRAISQVEWLEWVPGFPMSERLTILNAGLLLAFMAVPTIFTLTEDALNNVPGAMTENSLAMGATKLQTVFRVIVPTAVSGLIAAILLGFGRIIGETMVVLLVAGNKIKIPDFTEGIGVIAQPTHTMTGIIAQELGEVDNGSLHWRALFMVGMILFMISLLVNFAAQRILKKFQKI